MRPPDTKEDAPSIEAGGLSNFERLPGAFDELHNAAPFVEQADTDFRAIGIGLNPCEAAQSRCTPLVLERNIYDRLAAAGIHGDGVCGHKIFDALCCERVAFLSDGRFAFAWERAAGERRSVLIVPARDEAGDLCDLAAWDFKAGGLAAWTGAASMLGAENIYAPRLDGPLIVHETIADWLRAGRRGVFILDARRAAPLLRLGEPLGVKREVFGRRLRQALTIPAPKIAVGASGGRAA